MTTLTTTIRAFRFDISTPEGREGWREFRTVRSNEGFPRAMESLGNMSGGPRAGFYYWPELDGAEITLETGAQDQNLFDNQWNAAPMPGFGDGRGRRVFDWAIEAAFDGAGRRVPIRQGHYLDQTPEMRALRREVYVCGYCGHKERAARGSVFCPACIGSEYLKESNLHLLRMRAVEVQGDRAPLTEAERAHLVPLYIQAQTHGNTDRDKARIAKARADVLAKYAKATTNATAERDGFLWLMDRGIKTDNVIFYSHTGRFSFGWRRGLGPEEVSALLSAMGAEFPHSYEIVRADGSKMGSA